MSTYDPIALGVGLDAMRADALAPLAELAHGLDCALNDLTRCIHAALEVVAQDGAE